MPISRVKALKLGLTRPQSFIRKFWGSAVGYISTASLSPLSGDVGMIFCIDSYFPLFLKHYLLQLNIWSVAGKSHFQHSDSVLLKYLKDYPNAFKQSQLEGHSSCFRQGLFSKTLTNFNKKKAIARWSPSKEIHWYQTLLMILMLWVCKSLNVYFLEK